MDDSCSATAVIAVIDPAAMLTMSSPLVVLEARRAMLIAVIDPAATAECLLCRISVAATWYSW